MTSLSIHVFYATFLFFFPGEKPGRRKSKQYLGRIEAKIRLKEHYFSSILHTETVVAVQELARFRKRTLPSHFLLNCAITWWHHERKYHYWHEGCSEGRNGRFYSHRNLPRRCKSRKEQPHRDPRKEKLHFTSISSLGRNFQRKFPLLL